MILSFASLFSQEVNPLILEKIKEGGISYTTFLKNGNIESLRKANPPKDTWLFSKLEKYKQNLGSKDILYGSIITPSNVENSNLYFYNLFAYDIKKEFYYFAAIVSFKVIDDNVQFESSFLFTENESLQNWWMNIFSFYESEKSNTILEKYNFKTCPPPPFRS
jgi:hypothetical protein